MSQTLMNKVAGEKPRHAKIILPTLILGSVTANLNLSIANIALPDIGRDLQASQVQLTMVASMFTLGLAATVLYLGALGDRYGRKILLLLGAALSIPASLVAAYAPNVEVLIGARLVGGFAAGMLYPTTLSLISALWRGTAKTKAIAIWSASSAGAAALGGVTAGLLLENFWWGSVFLVTVPLATIVFVVTMFVIPRHAGEAGTRVDHLGGVLSVLAVATLIVGIQKIPDGLNADVIIPLSISVVGFGLLYWRLRRAPHPLVDLKLASVPTFWVASVGGMISFGSLVAAMFLGQQFVQNVLGFPTLEAALVVLPCSLTVLVTAPISARVIIARGSRFALAWGMTGIAIGFLIMIIFWRPGASLLVVLLAYAVLGLGVGFTATPTSRSLMESLPMSRAGMGSAFSDLNRDFGGAIMQAVMGTALAIGYSDYLQSKAKTVPPEQLAQLDSPAREQILSSYEAAEQVAANHPQDLQQLIIEGAQHAFTMGKTIAYTCGFVVTVLALILVLRKYPKKEAEQEIFQQIAADDPGLSEQATAT